MIGTVVDNWGHALSLVVRFDDHFLGHAVGEELAVRIEGAGTWPVRAAEGGYRHADGTYRFIDLPVGRHRVLWQPRFPSAAERWVSWEAPLEVTVPRAEPGEVIHCTLWPAANAPAPPGLTAVRGKLRGALGRHRRVVLAPAGASATHHTYSDANGEMLFLLPRAIAPDSSGLVSLEITITSVSVAGGEIASGPGQGTFTGNSFRIAPGRENRVFFDLT
jgi:hypothetical protein